MNRLLDWLFEKIVGPSEDNEQAKLRVSEYLERSGDY